MIGPGVIIARAQVYWGDIGYGRKPWLVVSNNQRNIHRSSVMAVRITTTVRTASHTVIKLSPADGLVGVVLCDDLEQIDKDQLHSAAAAITATTMARVESGLRIALSL